MCCSCIGVSLPSWAVARYMCTSRPNAHSLKTTATPVAAWAEWFLSIRLYESSALWMADSGWSHSSRSAFAPSERLSWELLPIPPPYTGDSIKEGGTCIMMCARYSSGAR